MEEIRKMEAWEGAQLNTAKEILAYELTKLVHSEADAEKAQADARALFGAGSADSAPEFALSADDFEGGVIDVLGVLVKSGMAPSRSEARRNVEQGGVTVNGEKVNDIKKTYSPADFEGGLLFKKGKKSFKKIVVQ